MFETSATALCGTTGRYIIKTKCSTARLTDSRAGLQALEATPTLCILFKKIIDSRVFPAHQPVVDGIISCCRILPWIKSTRKAQLDGLNSHSCCRVLHVTLWYFPNDQQPGGEQQSRLITRITNYVFGFSSCSGPLTADRTTSICSNAPGQLHVPCLASLLGMVLSHAGRLW